MMEMTEMKFILVFITAAMSHGPADIGDGDFLQSLLDAAKDDHLRAQRATQLMNCDQIEVQYQNATTQLELDRDHALADKCGGQQ
jgi:hypothetical protein